MTLKPEDFRLYVKSNDVIVGEIPKFDRLVFRDALNKPGGWTLQTDYDGKQPAAGFGFGVGAAPLSLAALWATGDGPGALSGNGAAAQGGGGQGIVVQAPGGDLVFGGVMMPYMSGLSQGQQATTVLTGTRTQTATTDKHIMAGVSDLALLGWRHYVPPPPVADEYPQLSGNPGQVIPALVQSQVGATAATLTLANHAEQVRRLSWLYGSAAIAGGSTITGRYSWGNLLATCRDFLEGWDGDTPLVMRVAPGWDNATFSVAEAEHSGELLTLGNAALETVEQGRSPSSANRPVALSYDANGELQATYQTAQQQGVTIGIHAGDLNPGYKVVETLVNMTDQPDGAVTTDTISSAFGGALDYVESFYTGVPSKSSDRFYRVGELVAIDTPAGRINVPVAETFTTITPNSVEHTFTLGSVMEPRSVNQATSSLYVPFKR